MSDEIPVVERYQGVGIHDQQPPERIQATVKPEIDRVLAMLDVAELAQFAGDVRNCPEARLLAAAMVEVVWEMAAEGRRVRPNVNLENVRAFVAGLNSVTWRSPWAYCSLLEEPARAVVRAVPLPD